MRRKRTARTYVWPVLAATTVTLILVSNGPLRRFLGTPSEGVDGLPTPSPRMFASAARPPRTLIASGRAGQGIDIDFATPRDGRSLPGDHPRGVRANVESNLAAPDPNVASATLQAPVRQHRDEMAGYDSLPFSSKSAPPGGGYPLGGVPVQAVAWPVARSDSSTENIEFIDSGRGWSLRYSDSDLQSDGEHAPWSRHLASGESGLGDVDGNAATDVDEPRSTLPDRGAAMGWPRTPALEASLSQLAKWPSSAEWVARVRAGLLALRTTSSLSDPQAGPRIAELESLAHLGIQAGEAQLADRAHQESLLRTSGALLRRTTVWNAVWRVGQSGGMRTVAARRVRTEPLGPIVEKVRAHMQVTGDVAGWNEYLLLEDVERLAEHPDAAARRLLAQRLLSRIDWAGLEPRQRGWLDHSSLHALAGRIRPWTDRPVDYVALLDQLERQESDALDLGSIDVATAVQNLRFGENERAVAVAESINDYYRNANIRLAVSVDLLRRLLPEVPDRTTPIRRTISGAPVRGSGVVQSNLGIELVPHSSAWQLRLWASGSVDARTASRHWPVTVRNRSNSQYSTATPILIDRHGVQVGDTDARVQSQVQLRGLQTDFDGLPVVEQLVRGIALVQYDGAAGEARQQSERILREEISDTVAGEIEQRVDLSSAQVASHLLGPLAKLRLDPLVVDLRTTESRLAVRYRVAGDWQLAAFTPRPRAMSDSLLSLQVHQSTLNNTFERLLPSANPQPIREVVGDIRGMFGADPAGVSDELPEDVRIQFAATRPITIEIHDGRLWLTLRVVRLEDSHGLDLSHFVVRVAYRAETDGLRARLVRDSVLNIRGPRMGMRERLPIRVIFNKVLNENHALPLVSETLASHPAAVGLCVGQVELTDGWIGLSVNPSPRLATGWQGEDRPYR